MELVLRPKFWFVYFRPSLRGQTAKTSICTKSGVSADSRKSAKKVPKSAEYRTFCAFFAHFLESKSAVFHTFRHFLALFLESAETPLFVQINVFAVWPLRLGRKYTNLKFGDRPYPQNHLRQFSCLTFLILISEVTFTAPPKTSFPTSIKRNLARLVSIF